MISTIRLLHLLLVDVRMVYIVFRIILLHADDINPSVSMISFNFSLSTIRSCRLYPAVHCNLCCSFLFNQNICYQSISILNLVYASWPRSENNLVKSS